jgi:4'-phosphopantetheinyl transferase
VHREAVAVNLPAGLGEPNVTVRDPLADEQRPPPPASSWPDGTRVWLIDPSTVLDATLARGVGGFDAAETARAARFVRESDRRLFQVAHLAARVIVGAALGRSPGQVVFDRAACPGCGGPHGRPIVAGGGVEFSLSHTPGLVALALAPVPVGVDVEGETAHAWAEVTLSLHPAERREIEAAADPAAAFARAWTRTEAYLKALGIGLGREPSLDYLGGGPTPAGTAVGFVVRDLPTPAGFHGAVVTRRT